MEKQYVPRRSAAAIIMLCLCLSACAAPAGTVTDIMPGMTTAQLSSPSAALPVLDAEASASPSPAPSAQNTQAPAPETSLPPTPTEIPSPAPVLEASETEPRETTNENAQTAAPDMEEGARSQMKELLHLLETLTPGVDYVENELLASFHSENEARDFAARYELELVSYTPDIAVFRSDAPLLDVLQRMMAASCNLPALSLNYRRTLGVGEKRPIS